MLNSLETNLRYLRRVTKEPAMDKFISALEQENPGATSVLIRDWWPLRLSGSTEVIYSLRYCLHGASMFTPSFSEMEAELILLRDITHQYILEAISNGNT